MASPRPRSMSTGMMSTRLGRRCAAGSDRSRCPPCAGRGPRPSTSRPDARRRRAAAGSRGRSAVCSRAGRCGRRDPRPCLKRTVPGGRSISSCITSSDDDRHAVVVENRAHRPAAQVHIALRLYEPQVHAVNVHLADVGVETLFVLERGARTARQFVHTPKTGVVQRIGVPVLRVTRDLQ